jgi:phospholipid transport system substrate-binding protein
MTRLALALVFALMLPAAAQAQDAKSVIDSKYSEIQQIIQTDKTDEGVRQKITAVLETFTDFNQFSRLTLKKFWKDLTPEQKSKFIDRYRKLLHKSYTQHFKAGQTLELSFRGEPKIIKDKALIRTLVKSGDTTAEVDYKMHLVDGQHKAYDIVVDEVSLMRNYRKQFYRIMKRDGFDVLIEKIEKKLAKKDDDSDDIE